MGAQPCSAVPMNPAPAGTGWGPCGPGGPSGWSLGLASCALAALAVGVPAVSSLCAVSHGQDEHCWGTNGAAGAGALGQLPQASPAGTVPSLCHFFPSQPMFLGVLAATLVTPHLYRVLEKSLFLEDPGLGFAGLLAPLAPSHLPAQERGSCSGEFGSGDHGVWVCSAGLRVLCRGSRSPRSGGGICVVAGSPGAGGCAGIPGSWGASWPYFLALLQE